MNLGQYRIDFCAVNGSPFVKNGCLKDGGWDLLGFSIGKGQHSGDQLLLSYLKGLVAPISQLSYLSSASLSKLEHLISAFTKGPLDKLRSAKSAI